MRASAVLTLLLLIVSDIVPKTLGARYWRELAPAAARTLSVLILITAPLVALSGHLTRLLGGGRDPHAVHRDELTALAELAAERGVIHANETRILRALLRLGAVRTRDIMTPRTVMYRLPEALTVGEFMAAQEFRFSRIPVHGGDPDACTATC